MQDVHFITRVYGCNRLVNSKQTTNLTSVDQRWTVTSLGMLGMGGRCAGVLVLSSLCVIVWDCFGVLAIVYRNDIYPRYTMINRASVCEVRRQNKTPCGVWGVIAVVLWKYSENTGEVYQKSCLRKVAHVVLISLHVRGAAKSLITLITKFWLPYLTNVPIRNFRIFDENFC